MKTKDAFRYGQWFVIIEMRDYDHVIIGSPSSDTPYCAIDVIGNWVSTQGILYDYWRECCAYNEPRMLPDGLKKRIYNRAMKLLAQCYK